jgi:alkylhydroperoxidase family enzyme
MSGLPAPRVAPLPRSRWTTAHFDVVARLAEDDPIDPLSATLLHVPEMVEAVAPMTRYITRASSLSPSQRLLVTRRAAWLNRNDALWAMHAGQADLEQGVIGLATGDREDHDGTGRSLLQLADELVLNASVNDTTWTRLASEHDLIWMMDAVETVAHVTFLCCLAGAFGVHPPDHLTSADGSGPDRPAALPREPPLTVARIEPLEGDEIAVLRTFARHPVMTAARRPRAAFVNRLSPLTPHDRETLILRMGWVCRSEYEWAKHVGSVGHARDHGVDPGLVAAGPAAPGVSAGDALLMQIADELHQDAAVSDRSWRGLLERHGLDGAMSAVFTASSYRATSMSLNAYGVQLEPGDEGFPRSDR